MTLHCGVWAGELGKGDLPAPGPNSESGGGIRCLLIERECVGRHSQQKATNR